MNITLVMSSSITTTLTMGAGLAVGAAVADGELGSVMGSMLLNVHAMCTDLQYQPHFSQSHNELPTRSRNLRFTH